MNSMKLSLAEKNGHLQVILESKSYMISKTFICFILLLYSFSNTAFIQFDPMHWILVLYVLVLNNNLIY